MSSLDNTPREAHPSDTPPSSARLVHELANLLDGSLRNITLAVSGLRDMGECQQTPANLMDDASLQRLDTARDGMQQMAMLLRRWMHQNRRTRALYTQHVTLACAIDRAVDLLTPAAMSHGVTISTDIAEPVRQLPAGALYPVIANALRNSLEAIASQGPIRDDGQAIDVRCSVNDGQLVLTVEDDGPGLDPALFDKWGQRKAGTSTSLQGLGLGLDLSRQIAAACGGVIELVNRTSGGARFALCCPVSQIAPAPDNGADEE